MILTLLQRALAFGCVGLLVEVFFTGIHSAVIHRNKTAQAKTYLWMLPIYGVAGVVLQWESNALGLFGINLFVRGIVHVAVIYLIEFSAGLILHKILGRCPWKYVNHSTSEEVHKFSIMGFVRLDYVFYWYGLALLFDKYSGKISTIIDLASKI